MEKPILVKETTRKSSDITFWQLVSEARAYLKSPTEYKLRRLNRSMSAYRKLPTANIKRLMRLRLFLFKKSMEIEEGSATIPNQGFEQDKQ